MIDLAANRIDKSPLPNSTPARSRLLEWLLRIGCATMLLGHAWVCWKGDMPLRALLWDEEMMTGVVQSVFKMSWGDWVSSLEVDDGINRAIRIQSWIFLGFGIAALVPIRRHCFPALYLLATLNLAFLAWLKYRDAGSGIGELVEHASQVAFPSLLWIAVIRRRWGRAATAVAMLAIALTFIGHGLFAADLPATETWLNHPRPGTFTEMTMLCLGMEEETAANRLLRVAGVLDFLAAALLLVPRWPRLLALLYMTAWGFLTALARPWAYYEPTAAAETLSAWIPHALYRTPHFFIPICLLLALTRRKAEITDSAPPRSD